MSVTEPGTTSAEDSVPPPAATGTGAPRGASVFVAAAATAGWAALVSFVPLLVVVLLGWLVSGGGASATGALRVAGAAWLLGNGVPVQTSTGPFGLIPLALTALFGWRLVRAGGNTARALGDRRAALVGAVGVALGYGLLAAIAALLVSVRGLDVSAPRAFVTAGGFALICAVAGAAHRSGILRHVAGQLSPAVRVGIRSAAFATVTLLGLGAFTVGAALAWHADDAADTLHAYQAGPVGDIGITLLCLAYAPTVSVWAVSYLSGPGFAFGTHTAVGIGGVHLGPVPAVPLLAALPTSAAPTAGALLLGLPLLVGVVTGWLAARRETGPGLVPLLLSTALAGALTGAAFAVAGALSSGGLGGGRLAEIGPSAWQLGLAVAGLIGLAAMAAAVTARTVARVRPRPYLGTAPDPRGTAAEPRGAAAESHGAAPEPRGAAAEARGGVAEARGGAVEPRGAGSRAAVPDQPGAGARGTVPSGDDPVARSDAGAGGAGTGGGWPVAAWTQPSAEQADRAQREAAATAAEQQAPGDQTGHEGGARPAP